MPEVTEQVAETPLEAAPPEETTQAQDEKTSPKLLVLMNREKQARAAEAQAKAERQAALQEREALAEKLKRIEEFETVKTNPKKALELLGIDYNELTQSMLAEGEVPASVQIRRLEEKLTKYEQAQEAKEKERLESEQKRAEASAQATVKSFKSEIGKFLDEKKDRYELISFESQENREDLIYELIEAHYQNTIDPETGVGKIMSIEEACDKAEQKFEEKYSKAKELSKIKSLYGIVPPKVLAQAIKQESPRPMPKQPPKTLTNQLTSTQTKPQRPLNDDERVRRAIATVLSQRG